MATAMSRLMMRMASLLLVGLVACGEVVAGDDLALGMGDWSLSYVDAGSYYEVPRTPDDDPGASSSPHLEAPFADPAFTDAAPPLDDASPSPKGIDEAGALR